MGINSTATAYNYGQLGSAYSDDASRIIVPPKDHVIVAIQNIGAGNCTPTLMTPEKLGVNGPNFTTIGETGGDTLIAAANVGNMNGVVSVALTDNAGSNITTVALSAGANAKVKKGQFVLLANADAQVDDGPALAIDAQTPIPIYNGPNARGVKISKVDGANVTLTGHGNTAFAGISPDSQMLICIDEHHGAGGMDGDGMVIAAGVTIYGRWTEFSGDGTGQMICYFGK
tara:strand:+ start:296 stop:982 length:687 start_codon:yes stop_codon:yes gene_type:complete